MTHLVCLGLGYSASAVALRLRGTDGWRVTGTSRTGAGAQRIGDLGLEAIIYDGGAPSHALSQALMMATHLLVSAAPDDDGDPLLSRHRADVLSAPRLRWIGYLSTIGVYGDQGGAWVDEATPVAPTSRRSRLRVDAEHAWEEVVMARPQFPRTQLQIFRLAGIYGPGRSAIDKVRDGTARRIIKQGQVFNRIHVDDIATTVLAGMAQTGRTDASGAQVFNVCDDEPAPPQNVIAFAAELVGQPVPPDIPFEEASLGAMARSFYSDLKRVRNTAIKQQLGVALAFPTYREGLRAIVERDVDGAEAARPS